MATNTSTGMGQGAAQVFGPNQAAQQYMQNLRLGIAQQQSEFAGMQKLLSTLNAQKGRMRPQDIREFNDKYGQLQNLYIQNKGLYRTPTRYPELYQKSVELQGELRQLVTDSVQQGEYMRSIINGSLTNPDLFDDETKTVVERYNSLPTSAIKQNLNGEFLSPIHLQYQPKPVDWAKFGQDFDKFAKMNDGAEIVVSRNKTPDGVWIDEQEKTVYKPESAMAFAANEFQLDSKFRKNMAYALRNSSRPELEKLQTQVDAILGDKTFDIKDPLTYAQAQSVVSFKESPTKSKRVQNPEYAQGMANYRMREGIKSRERMQAKRLAAAKDNDSDVLVAQANQILEAASTGDANKIRSVAGEAFNYLGKKIGGGVDDKPVFIAKSEVLKRGGNFETFKREIKRRNALSVNGTYSVDESDAAIKQYWDEGAAIISVPVSMPDPSDNKKTITKYANVGSLKNRRPQDVGKFVSLVKALGAPDNKKGILRFDDIEDEDLGTGNE